MLKERLGGLVWFVFLAKYLSQIFKMLPGICVNMTVIGFDSTQIAKSTQKYFGNYGLVIHPVSFKYTLANMQGEGVPHPCYSFTSVVHNRDFFSMLISVLHFRVTATAV